MEAAAARLYYSYHSYSSLDDQTTPAETLVIPVDFGSAPPTPIPVSLPPSLLSSAAEKIQAAYRGHRARTFLRLISAVNFDADRLERMIQSQDTVDAVRSDPRERIRMNEGLMALLLRLDTVPGIDSGVRERRRAASRRIVALQELVDAVAEENIEAPVVFPASWGKLVARTGNDCERQSPCAEEAAGACLEKLGLWLSG